MHYFWDNSYNQHSRTLWGIFHNHIWLPEGEHFLEDEHPLVNRGAGLFNLAQMANLHVIYLFKSVYHGDFSGQWITRGKVKSRWGWTHTFEHYLISGEMSIHVLFWSILGFTRVPGFFGLYPIDARAVHPRLEWMLAMYLILMLFSTSKHRNDPFTKKWILTGSGPMDPTACCSRSDFVFLPRVTQDALYYLQGDPMVGFGSLEKSRIHVPCVS